jgi:hypothetical protein
MVSDYAHVFDTAWKLCGDPAEDSDLDLEWEYTRLLTTLNINGLSMHIEAFEVFVDDSVQKPVNPRYEEAFADWHHAAGGDGHFQTVEIFGRSYVLFASPYC